MNQDVNWQNFRDQFPTLDNTNYLNTCSLGLLSNDSKDALLSYIDTWTTLGASAWYSVWMEKINSLKEEFAKLINASPDEIAIMPSVSQAIAVISSCIDLNPDDEVVTSELDFPTIAHNFMGRESKGQGKVKIVKSESMQYVDVEKFISHISEKTKLVATSRVYYLSGYINDYEKIMNAAKNNNALFFLDDYQATGQLPINVKEQDIDIFVTGGLKWLLGGSGVVYMYVRKELINQLEPSVTGWHSHKRQFEFDPHTLEFSDTASRFETGTPSISAVYPAEQGIKLINEIGVENIRNRTLYLTSLLVNSLIELGFSLRVPEDLNGHAGITMVDCSNPSFVVEELKKAGIIVDSRPGCVRISPFFYNNESEIDHCVNVLSNLKNSDNSLF